jgi:arylsulfatase A-like enzyme
VSGDRRFTLAVLVALTLSGCSPKGGDRRIVLVTLDTFRADYLGCAGNPLVRTPHIDRLARGGTHWSEAVTPIPLTTPSHASILSGLSPRAHGVLRNRMRLPEHIATLPELLQKHGFQTAAFVSSVLVLHPELGLNQGFDTYQVVETELPASGEGADTAQRAQAWLRAERKDGDSFLWVHFFDAHLPYLPPSPLEKLYDTTAPSEGAARLQDSKTVQALGDSLDASPQDVAHLRALYASEVTFVDRCVGEVFQEALLAPGGETSFVLTSDHGEGLFEHRYFGHDKQLYDTSLRVPCILAGGQIPRGRVVREPARTFDLAPTILGLCGLPRAESMEGRDLLLDPPPSGEALLFIAETYPSSSKSSPLYALRTQSHKVVWEPRWKAWEFYNLVSDPGETKRLPAEDSRELQDLAGDLELDLRNRRVGRLETIDDERGGQTEHVKQALESLGYLN